MSRRRAARRPPISSIRVAGRCWEPSNFHQDPHADMIDHLSITTTDVDRAQAFCWGHLAIPEVRAFYEAALKHGGTDDGPPGLRPQYHPDYYGAFVRDSD